MSKTSDMSESSTYDAILREGRAIGRAEAKAEGITKQARRMLLLFGRQHLGPPAPRFEATIEAMTDVEYMEALLGRLLEASNWEEWITGTRCTKINSRTLAPPTMNIATPALSKPDFGLPQSHEAFARANRVIPGGVNSPARAFGGVGGEPPFIARYRRPFLY
jgi:hypothetical protein